jgi:hypothetical protein
MVCTPGRITSTVASGCIVCQSTNAATITTVISTYGHRFFMSSTSTL